MTDSFLGIPVSYQDVSLFVILGVPVSYQDVSSIDPEYAKNLQVGSSAHV